MTDLCFSDALEIAAHLRARRMSAVECLAYFRQRVDRFNPGLNAIILVDWERATRRAERADQARTRSEDWGPFHGVPMTVKESFELAHHPTTWGDPTLLKNVAMEDDVAVQRLERAGAVVFGKTNVPLRLLDFQTHNALSGVTRNPWDLSRTCGGSSGGSAAALAAGVTGLELGSDLGGSLRQPAHCCGVFAHKPTFGTPGTHITAPGRAAFTDMAVSGPMARSAEDLMAAMFPLTPPETRPLRSYRVAVLWNDVEPDIQDACQRLADALARKGVAVSTGERPDVNLRTSQAVYLALLDVAVNPLSPMTRAEWEPLRTEIRQQWAGFFQRWDAVIAPVSPVVAFPHDHRPVSQRTVALNGRSVPYEELLFWPSLASLAYLPATAFPAGRTRQGLPVGLQVMAAEGNDAVTLDVAGQISRELGGFTPPPGFTDGPSPSL
jgi:amidase